MSHARACAGRGPEPDVESSHGKRIVDALIGERAPTLYRFAPTRWAMRHLLQPVLHYREAVETAERIAGLGGHEIMALGVSRLGLQVRTLGLYRLPSRGRVILAPNHPTGLADGVAVWEALRRGREGILIPPHPAAVRPPPRPAPPIIPVGGGESRR